MAHSRVMVCNRSGAGNYHFRELQTMLERQKRLSFLPEMQSRVTTNCDNSSGPSIKHGVLGGYILKKQRKRTRLGLLNRSGSFRNV